MAPDHLPAQEIGLLPHGVPPRLVPQQLADLTRQGTRVAEGDQHAAAVGQQLLGVPVRRRDHRLAAAERIRQRTRGDLRRVQVRRDVDVRHPDEFDQLVDVDEPVVEAHVRLDAQVLGQPLQADSVALPLLAEQVRVRRPQNDVEEVGEFLEDRRHRLEHVLDPLVRREQPERQGDELPLDPELILVEVRVDERHVGDAVGDQVDLGLRDIVNVTEEAACSLGHDDQAGRHLGDLPEHAVLIGVRVAQHGVERGDDWRPQIAHQPEDVAAGGTAEDAVFVLEADDVGIGEIEEVGRSQVRVDLLLLDLEPHLRRVVVTLGQIVDRDDETIGPRILGGDRRTQIIREGRDAAFSWQIIADERDLLDLTVSFHRLARDARPPCAGNTPGADLPGRCAA